MTDDPIKGDGRRGPPGGFERDPRRTAANADAPPDAASAREAADLAARMLADRAQTWPEAMERAAFLLRRYAETPDARDLRVETLIQRSLGDMTRLARREGHTE